MSRFSSLWSVMILGTLIVLLIFFLPYERSTRTNNVQWVGFIGKTSRDIAYNLAVLKDGIITAGWSSSSNGDQNALLVKLSKEGKLLWQKELGGSGTDGAMCVKATSDGGFLAAVLSDSQDGDLPVQFGGQDLWLLKYDTNGNLQWKNCYGSKGYETAFDVLEDEGYLFVGYTTLSGSEDFWIVKTDLSGKMIWEKTFGGSDWDCAFGVAKQDDSYIIVGMTRSSDGDVQHNNGSADIWLIKLSKTGQLTWQKTFGGSDWDQATSVINTKDGGFAVAATSWSEEMIGKSRSADFVLMKFDKDSNLTFMKTYGGSSDDIAQKVIETEDGYALVGTTWSDDGDVSEKHRGSDYWFIKTDKAGNLTWQKCLGDDMDEIAYTLQELDETYLIAGVSYSYVVGLRARSHGGGDMLIVKVK
ncbi:hypothetical protein ACSFC1_10090 [Pseudothermotoga sp. U03pept]|uniref:hypothetical protein n=1 Tax=Pseudothermotoga sp. U03pept TaxID=3447012 RepID=UPI003F06CCBF